VVILENKISLKDGWVMKSCFQVEEGGEVVSTDEFTSNGWYSTLVPSTVLNALVRNGVYPDPRVGLNAFLIPDASDEFNDKYDLAKYSYLPDERNPWKDPYWYRTEFDLPETHRGKRVWLNFECLNYRADVWLNGNMIADRELVVGMFQRFRFDITNYVKIGKNYLAVKIYPVDHPGVPEAQLDVIGKIRDYHKSIMKDVTEVMSIGYDCAPTIPDRNMGIIQEVYIDFTGPVEIRNPFIVTDLPLPKTSPAYLTVSAELMNTTDSSQKGVLRGIIKEDEVKFEKNVELEPNEKKVIFFYPEQYPQLSIRNPRLWWPNNYGEQNLYNLSLVFEVGEETSDEQNLIFGIRKITKELYQLDGSYGLRLRINGRKIFCRGGYIQPELMFNWDKKRLNTEVRYFTEANLNYVCFEDIPNPPDEFLDACDRYGLMYWNDFYCCGWLQPDTDYPSGSASRDSLPDISLLEKCTVDIIKRYRNHPSLILYMPMNEGETREEVYEMWRKNIIEFDGTRLFIPSGSFPDYREDVPEWIKKDTPVGMNDYPPISYQWQEPSTYYRWVREERNWMFMIESGSASLPPIESLKSFIPDLGKGVKGVLYPLNETWAHHGANEYYKGYDRALRRRYGAPESVEDYCWKGHLVTANQHRAMFEAVNHRIWDITSGFGEWKLNSCWPSVQWQIFDWYLRPMVSYYYIKKACEPLHVQLNPINSTVTVINNNFESQEDLEVTVKMYDFDMKSIWEKNVKTSIEANTYRDIFSLPSIVKRQDWLWKISPVYYVKLELKDSNNNLVSDNFYWLSSHVLVADDTDKFIDLRKLPTVRLDISYEIEKKGEENVIYVTLKNPTDNLAFFIHLAVTKDQNGEEVLPVFWDDNYFCLIPTEHKQVSAVFAEEDLDGATPAVKVEGWNIESASH
jgi:exo-1,4-beta-D-glucosaminidase